MSAENPPEFGFNIGPVRVAPATALAPMEGITDKGFRALIRGMGGCGLTVTEFVSSDLMSRKVASAWRLAELRRWSARKGLDLNLQPAHFPVDESTAAKCVLALQATGENPLGFMGRAHRVVWVEDRDLSDPAIVAELLQAEGFDAEGIMNRAQQDDVAQAYDSGPEQAIEAGVFGAPTFIINDELFWGQDRLDWVEEEIKA